jgi:Mn2+/Fe2+ NRAMP family transporter
MSDKNAKSGLRKRLHTAPLLKQLGPGLITGAADDDPSGIATYSQGGAQFGFNLLWTMVLTFPLMAAIQMVSALIGRVTGRGLAYNMGQVMPRPLVLSLLVLLFIANTINVGADLAAMGEAAKLVLGFNQHAFTISFALLSLGLQLFIPYRKYARFLMVLTFSLFAYVAIMFLLPLDWTAIGAGLIGLHPNLTESAATTIVAIFGTTISPYLFFWQSAQEVEEVDQRPDEHPLIDRPREGAEAISRIRIDTVAGMLASNLIALAIMIATADTLPAHWRHRHQHRRAGGSGTEAHRGPLRLRPVQPWHHRHGPAGDSRAGGIGRLCGGRRAGLEDRPRQHALAGARLLFGDRGGGVAWSRY